MKLQPLDPQQVQPTAQTLLAFLDREDVTVPGNMTESIVSGKSLLRAIVSGQLVVCGHAEAPPAPPEDPETPADKPQAKKKVAKKTRKKAA